MDTIQLLPRSIGGALSLCAIDVLQEREDLTFWKRFVDQWYVEAFDEAQH